MDFPTAIKDNAVRTREAEFDQVPVSERKSL